MNITDELLHKVSEFLKQQKVSGNIRILAGFSGGPDSTVLLHILSLLRPSFGYYLSALYVDHGIRGKDVMAEECDSIYHIAREIQVELDIVHIPHGRIAAAAAKDKRSVEETAREFRYRIFSQAMEEKDMMFLALGHTLDDTVETLIMRVFQGSGLHGLTGISQTTGKILRPLGTVEKKALIRYSKENHLSPVTDETNNQSVYLRNKIRHNLLPEIRKIFPGYKKALIKMSRKLEMADHYISNSAGDLGRFSDDEGTVFLSLEEFFALSAYERMEILYQSWDKWTEKPFQRLSYKNIMRIFEGENRNNSRKILEGPGFSLVYSKDRFLWRRLVVSPKKSYLRVVDSGRYSIPSGVVVEVYPDTSLLEEKTWLHADLLDRPLVLRSRKPGDSIDLKEGRKSIKKLFGEWKVPEGDRWKIPLVSDKSGILLVLGEGFGYKNRVAVKHKKTGRTMSGEKIVFNTYMEK